MRKVYFVIIFILALAATLYFLHFLDSREQEQADFVEEAPIVGTTSPSESKCDFADQVEYYYYTGSDPNWPLNNKFGIYVYAENKSFFELAQNLVNSSGGEWGYVLVPYNVKDYDYGKWSNVFTMLRNKRLIPIIQLHDIDVDNYKKQTVKAARFLNSFLWPIRYRYISAYNEPNDKNFWFGKVDPEGYATILDYTVDAFKKENPNFFIMNGALNVTAPSNGVYMDAFDYMYAMNKEIPGIFNKLDGWASHSYPQPNFSGNPDTQGRWGVRAYEEELEYLKRNVGLEKNLPVFITETGWAHADGNSYNASYLSAEQVAENYKIAYTKYWLPDQRVRAVIPFTIWYDPPHDHFSWVNKDRVPYKQYDVVKEMTKVKGDPPILQLDQAKIKDCNL